MRKIIYVLLVFIVAAIISFLIRWQTVTADNIAPIVINHPKTVPEMIERMFKKDAPIMLRIAKAESSLDPKAENDHSTADGVFQILNSTWKGEGCKGSKLDALDNVRCAKILFDRYGTSPWNESKHAWNR